jgi:cellulose biosynthesis protein BcsQ
MELDYDVLVIDDVSSVLTHRLVDRLGRAGRVVVGVFDANRGATAKDRLLAAGVLATVASDATAVEFLTTINDAVGPLPFEESFNELVAEIGGTGHLDRDEAFDPARAGLQQSPADGRGTVVAVTGLDGRTEVAVALATAYATAGTSVILVDLDTLEPSIAQRLSVDLVPNVFTATEDLRLRSDLTHSFGRHPAGFAWVSGIPNPNEWAKLSEFEAADLVSELGHGFEVVIVKVPRYLPDLAGFGSGPGRFDVGRRVVTMADHVLAVAGPSPLSASRLLHVLADVRSLTESPVHIVINRAPSDAFQRGEIDQELRRSFDGTITFLPDENRVRKASWQGSPVGRGGFSRKVSQLAARVAPGEPDAHRRRRRKSSR